MRARDDRFVLPVSQAKECKQILSGGPWFYRRSQFVLAEYDGLQNVALVPLIVSGIDIRGLLDALMTEEAAEKMG